MSEYKVTTPRSSYVVEAENKAKARKKICDKESIVIEKQKAQPPSNGFIFLEQDDPRWDNVTIGNTPYTVGDWGCLITSLSMLSYWYKDYKDPAWIAKNLRYTSNGSLYWTSMNGKLPMNFVRRYYVRNITKIVSILKSKDNACVIEVPYGKWKHWLAVVGFEANAIVAADPIDGTRCYPESKYGKITGFAEVTRA